MMTQTLPERYEVVHGEIKELPEMGFYSSTVNNRIQRELQRYLFSHPIGECVSEILFAIPLDDDASRNCRPDVAYISHERWPVDRPLAYEGNALDVVPNLVVEVISPTDQADEVMRKAADYLRGQVEVVWLVYPLERMVLSIAGWANVRAYRADQQLEVPELLPGFGVSVASLFPPLLS